MIRGLMADGGAQVLLSIPIDLCDRIAELIVGGLAADNGGRLPDPAGLDPDLAALLCVLSTAEMTQAASHRDEN
jgi:hypothetical protein